MDHSKELLLLLKLLLTCLRQTLKLLASCQRSRKKVHWSNVWLFIQTLVWRGKCGSGILFYWWVEEEVEEWLVCGTKTFRGSGFFQTQVNVWWEGSVKGCWWMVCGSSNTNATCWLITLVCFHEKKLSATTSSQSIKRLNFRKVSWRLEVFKSNLQMIDRKLVVDTHVIIIEWVSVTKGAESFVFRQPFNA